MRHPAAIGVILTILGTVPAEAQSGRVTGGVRDETGAVLPGATVSLSGPEGTRVTQSDGDGEYAFAGVSAGDYALTVALTSFSEATVEDVVVHGTPPSSCRRSRCRWRASATRWWSPRRGPRCGWSMPR